MGLHVMADGPGRCRLVERGRTVHGTSLVDRLFFSPLLVEPIGFVMSREMLLGIKERAEGVGYEWTPRRGGHSTIGTPKVACHSVIDEKTDSDIEVCV